MNWFKKTAIVLVAVALASIVGLRLWLGKDEFESVTSAVKAIFRGENLDDSTSQTIQSTQMRMDIVKDLRNRFSNSSDLTGLIQESKKRRLVTDHGVQGRIFAFLLSTEVFKKSQSLQDSPLTREKAVSELVTFAMDIYEAQLLDHERLSELGSFQADMELQTEKKHLDKLSQICDQYFKRRISSNEQRWAELKKRRELLDL